MRQRGGGRGIAGRREREIGEEGEVDSGRRRKEWGRRDRAKVTYGKGKVGSNRETGKR